MQFTRERTQHAPNSSSNAFLRPPLDAGGALHDLSDRMLLCSSSNMRNEVVFGGSDHALYAINPLDPRSKPIQMYSKRCGHTDWVTTVSHLPDGKVISGAMDGRLLLWSERNRAQAVELRRDSMHPVTKVVTDARYNVAIACGYDGNISVWNFGDQDLTSDSSSNSGSGSISSSVSRTGRGVSTAARSSSSSIVRTTASSRANAAAAQFNQLSSAVPTAQLTAHSQSVLECAYVDNVFASGDKGGALIVWDLATGTAKHRFRAHPAGITGLICAEGGRLIVSSGSDGFVKLWDPRSSGSGLVQKIQAHGGSNNNNYNNSNRNISSNNNSSSSTSTVVAAARSRQPPGTSSSAGSSSGRSSNQRSAAARPAWDGSFADAGSNNSNNSSSVIRVSELAAGRGSATTTAAAATACPVGCMGAVFNRGSSGDVTYIVTGGGSPHDSALNVIDVRSNFSSVCRWDHHQNGVYSLCIVGDDCVLSGDGKGMLLSHHLLTPSPPPQQQQHQQHQQYQHQHQYQEASFADPASCLRYGVGASGEGAVRTLNCLSGKVVAGGEDGNVLVFDYEA